MKDVALQVITYILAPAATYLIGWIAARRKSRAEAEGAELDNVERAISIYKNLAKDLEAEMFSLKQEMIAMRKQNFELMLKLDIAHTENAQLKQKIESLEVKISSIKNL